MTSRLTLLTALLLLPQIAASQPTDVHKPVAAVAQTSNRNCWAAFAAMLVSGQRDGQPVTMQRVVEQAGKPYPKLLADDTGLSPKEETELYPKLKLQPAKAPSGNATPADWAALLQMHGPFAVIVRSDSGKRRLHALVLTGFKGDGTASQTNVTYVDPADGKVRTTDFSAFLELYGGIARWPSLVIHRRPPLP